MSESAYLTRARDLPGCSKGVEIVNRHILDGALHHPDLVSEINALLTQVRNETLEEAALKMEARRAAFKANAGSLRRSLALRALSMSDAFAHAAHDLRSLKSPG